MPVPVAAPAPNRSLPALFVIVAVAVILLRIVFTGGALWPSVWIGIAAATGATAITWALDRRTAS